MAMKSFEEMKSSIETFKGEIKDILLKAENNTILTDVDGLDRIYGYYYNLDGFGELVELQVKGIRLKNDKVEVLLDVCEVTYDMWDLLEEPEENWRDLFYDGEILGWFTAINIAEVLEEYI